MKLTKTLLANSFALTSAILWVLCSVFVALFPGFSFAVSKWWAHGMEIEALGSFNLDFNNFLWGGVTLVIALWVVGYVFGWTLEYLSGKK